MDINANFSLCNENFSWDWTLHYKNVITFYPAMVYIYHQIYIQAHIIEYVVKKQKLTDKDHRVILN